MSPPPALANRTSICAMLLLNGVIDPVNVGEFGHVGAHARDPAAESP